MISNLLKDAVFIVVALFCYLYLLTKVPKINTNMVVQLFSSYLIMKMKKKQVNFLG